MDARDQKELFVTDEYEAIHGMREGEKMADLEKVLKYLNDWIEDENAMDSEIEGSYVSDAIDLLEAQKKEIDRMNVELNPIKPDIDGHYCRCGRCDDYIMSAKQATVPINRESIRFCGHCGQPIDWTDLEKDGEQE